MRLKYTLFTLFISFTSIAQEYQTINYFSEDTISLDLDLFLPKEVDTDTKCPLVIFVYGGGFSGGARSSGYKLAKFLAGQHIACASISYTLYMQDKNFSCDGRRKMRCHNN